MKAITLGEIIKACNGRLVCAASAEEINAELPGRMISKIETDSRKILPGEANRDSLFLALKGERFDGNTFAEEAAACGVGAVLCSLPEQEAVALSAKMGNQCAVILAENGDTQKAFGDIAAYYRSLFALPVVAVTGSVGKTSTKEMIAAVLSGSRCVLKTEANFNNEIGLPRTLLALAPQHETAVVEMGMRGLGQIRYLCGIARPNIGVVTNIGDAHIEILKSRENILRAKLEIASYMGDGSVLCLNGDDPLLGNRMLVEAVLSEDGKEGSVPEIIYFGTGENASYRAKEIVSDEKGSRFLLCTPKGERRVSLAVPGRHHVGNALAAAAVAELCGMTLSEITRSLAAIGENSQIRQKIIKTNIGVTVIDDTYNAGPASMQASLDVLYDIGKGTKNRTAAVLGDMLELGEISERAHYEVGKHAAERGVSCLLTAGTLSKEIARGYLEAGGCDARCFPNSEEAADALMQILQKGDIILVKGSHAMKMETVVRLVCAAEKLPERKG